LRVPKYASFSPAPFGHQAASTLNAGGVELNELQVLVVQPCASDGCIAIPSASVCAGATLLGSPLPARGQHGVFSSEAVDGTIRHVHADDSDALAVLHDEVQEELLHEEVAVETQCTSEQSV